jgi:hypothetical protein
MTARLPYAHTRISLLLFCAQCSVMYTYIYLYLSVVYFMLS